MISNRCLAHLRQLVQTFPKPFRSLKHSRNLATVTDQTVPPHLRPHPDEVNPNLDTHITATIYQFPTMEPLHFTYYPRSHLFLPLRKDILHRAVIYEGDKARQGSANTKWRAEVSGSHKKVHRQKGLGLARAGDKQSPIRRGGGVAFGPKPRSFATGLQRKVYDLAWRTALSYRYRKGELVIVDAINNVFPCESWFLQQVFDANGWGRQHRRSMFVATGKRDDNQELFEVMEDKMGAQGRLLGVEDVDVKNLLEMGRVVVEKDALDQIILEHSSDIRLPLFNRTDIPIESQATIAAAEEVD